MKVLQRVDKISKKNEKMWSVQLDDNRWYDAYKYADDYRIMAKGNYSWAVPNEAAPATPPPMGAGTKTEDPASKRNASIEKQNACRHTSAIVAAFIGARPALNSAEVDALVIHYFNLFHKIISGEEGVK